MSRAISRSLSDLSLPRSTASRRPDYRGSTMSRPARPFPAGPVRDALGLVRLLWAVERDGIDIDRTRTLTEAGELLLLSLHLSRSSVDSLGHRAAGPRALDAIAKLSSIPWPADVAEVVRMACGRVTGETSKREDKRDAKRRSVAARG